MCLFSCFQQMCGAGNWGQMSGVKGTGSHLAAATQSEIIPVTVE